MLPSTSPENPPKALDCEESVRPPRQVSFPNASEDESRWKDRIGSAVTTIGCASAAVASAASQAPARKRLKPARASS
jgi:hypothetical protein